MTKTLKPVMSISRDGKEIDPSEYTFKDGMITFLGDVKAGDFEISYRYDEIKSIYEFGDLLTADGMGTPAHFMFITEHEDGYITVYDMGLNETFTWESKHFTRLEPE